MAETAMEEEPRKQTDSVANTSLSADRENLDRLLKIFNGGTGVNLGTRLVQAITMQATFDSSTQTAEDLKKADIILSCMKAARLRNDPSVKVKTEEGKEPFRMAKFGRRSRNSRNSNYSDNQTDDKNGDNNSDRDVRRVTLEDKKEPPKVAPHMTQRVKTFYMDPFVTLASRRDDIIIPKVPTKSARARSMIGGTPITKETAIELRQITLGSTVHSFCLEWRKSALVFHDMFTNFAYGLQTTRCGSRAMVLCFQGFMLKHLLFTREYVSAASIKGAVSKIGIEESALQPTEFERRRALSAAICEILWKAGNQIRCCLCLNQDETLFDSDYQYRVDGITEKLHLYEFKKYTDLEMFVKRHLSHFESENSNGCILLLYSVILSRTVTRVYEDMDSSVEEKGKLLTDNEGCTPALINLLLTGRAVQYYHNGTILYDNEGTLLPRPLKGIRERSQVGLLYWDKGEEEDERTEIGSMLKTPRSPIWLSVVNGQYGLLFSTNPDLVCEWRAEHHFVLHYYTGISKHFVTPLTIDTRYNRRMRVKTGLVRRAQEEKIPALEKCILTKWYGANIDWGGVFPYV